MSDKRQRLVVPATRFKRNLEAFVDKLTDVYQEKIDQGANIDLKPMNLVSLYVTGTDKNSLVKTFIANTTDPVDHWPNLHTKNELFFLKEWINLAPDRYRDKLTPYVKCVRGKDGSLQINKNDLEELWKLVHNMVKSSIHYINENKSEFDRKLTSKLSDLSAKWNVELGKKFYEEISDSESSEGSDESDSESS